MIATVVFGLPDRQAMPRKPKSSKPIRDAKAAAKQTAKQGRQIKRTAKAAKSAGKKVAKLLRAITGKKATKGKATKKKPSKSTSKKTIPKSTPKVKRSELPSVIKLKNIKQLQGKSWAAIVNDDKLLAKLDKLKRKEQFFIGSVFGNQTHKVFQGAKELIGQLNQYVDAHSGDDQKMIDTFTIGTLEGTPSEHAREVDARIVENKERAISERRELGATFGRTTERGKTKTFRDFAKDAVKAVRERDAKIDSLEARLAKLEKLLTGGAKKSKKKAVKKSTKKVSKKTNATKRGTTAKTKAKSGSSKGKATSAKRPTKGKTKQAVRAGGSKAKPKTGAKRAVKKATKKKR